MALALAGWGMGWGMGHVDRIFHIGSFGVYSWGGGWMDTRGVFYVLCEMHVWMGRRIDGLMHCVGRVYEGVSGLRGSLSLDVDALSKGVHCSTRLL